MTDLSAGKRLAEKATGVGRWRSHSARLIGHGNDPVWVLMDARDKDHFDSWIGDIREREDAEFIVWLVNNFEALVERLERAEAALHAIQAVAVMAQNHHAKFTERTLALEEIEGRARAALSVTEGNEDG